MVLLTISLFAGYWFYTSINDLKDEPNMNKGYQLSEPDFLKRYLTEELESEEHQMHKNIWTNPKFSDNPIRKLLEMTDQTSFSQLFNVRPVFKIVDLGEKQTNIHLIADLSTMQDVESVTFPTWGEQDGTTDLKMYEGTFNPNTKTWQVIVPIKNHHEAGLYKSQILVTKKNGDIEETEFGEFVISQPSLEVSLDKTRVTKGQFTVTIKVNSIADVEKLSIPIWSKKDQSDRVVYEGIRQASDTYQVIMDYEKHHFNNGLYTAQVYLTTANGLKVEKSAGTAEIQLSHPVRFRLLQPASVFQDRALTKVKAVAPANSMAYVEGLVYNGEEKIYKTTEGYISANGSQVNESLEDIQYIAHRGNRTLAPENSLPAFQQANTWGVETDIWLTKDKHWVVMHDETVDNMTNGKGKISDLTLEQIKALRIRSGNNVTNYNQSQLIVPTLEEYLNVMKERQKIPYIEIKPRNIAPDDYDRLVQLITSYGFSESVRVISFEFTNLVEMKKRMPNLHAQFLTQVLDDGVITQVSRLGNNAGIDVEYTAALSKIELIAKAQAQGFVVNLWVVPKENLEKVKALGPDNLTINF